MKGDYAGPNIAVTQYRQYRPEANGKGSVMRAVLDFRNNIPDAPGLTPLGTLPKKSGTVSHSFDASNPPAEAFYQFFAYERQENGVISITNQIQSRPKGLWGHIAISTAFQFAEKFEREHPEAAQDVIDKIKWKQRDQHPYWQEAAPSLKPQDDALPLSVAGSLKDFLNAAHDSTTRRLAPKPALECLTLDT